MIDGFPIPPAPVRAIDVQRCIRSTIVSTNSPRPKKTFGAGGGNSPGTVGANAGDWVGW